MDELAKRDLEEEDGEVQKRLKAEYFVLRTALVSLRHTKYPPRSSHGG